MTLLIIKVILQNVPELLASVSQQYSSLELRLNQLQREKDAADLEIAELKKEAAARIKSHHEDMQLAQQTVEESSEDLKKCRKELEKAKKDAAQREKDLQSAALARDETLEGKLRSLIEALSGSIFSACFFSLRH